MNFKTAAIALVLALGPVAALAGGFCPYANPYQGQQYCAPGSVWNDTYRACIIPGG